MRKDRLDPSHTDDLELLSSYTSWILERNALLRSQQKWLRAINANTKTAEFAEDKQKEGQQQADKAAKYLKDFDTAYIELLKDITERAGSSLAESRETLKKMVEAGYKSQLGQDVASSLFKLDASMFVRTKFALRSAHKVLAGTKMLVNRIQEAVTGLTEPVDFASDAGKALMTAKEELAATLQKERSVVAQIKDDFDTADEEMGKANSKFFELVKGLYSASGLLTDAAGDLERLTDKVDQEQASELVETYVKAEKKADKAVAASEAAATSIQDGNDIPGFMKKLHYQYKTMVTEHLKEKVKQMQKVKDSPQKRAFDAYDKEKNKIMPEAAQSFLEEVPF
ncbi:unnamed protein product [Amoebophrya sp. A25]|nr:unnamed protein product [Amoebophrya sp. A25]|eukprot:GSA25T00016298001.1